MKLGTKVKVKGQDNIGELVAVTNWKFIAPYVAKDFLIKNLKNDMAIVFFSAPVPTCNYTDYYNSYRLQEKQMRGIEAPEDFIKHSYEETCFTKKQYIPLKELEAV